MTIHGTLSVRRALGVLCAGAAALAVSACGSGTPTASGGEASGGPVQTKDLDGVGTVLVDRAGKTLYFTDTESSGQIKCTEECLQLWVPATAPGDPVQAPVADVGVMQRPDGVSQLTYQNKPLYTFTLDSADKPASGHNATDSFGGEEFTWHAVVVAGSGGQQQPPKNDDPYGGGGGY